MEDGRTKHLMDATLDHSIERTGGQTETETERRRQGMVKHNSGGVFVVGERHSTMENVGA